MLLQQCWLLLDGKTGEKGEEKKKKANVGRRGGEGEEMTVEANDAERVRQASWVS